jgi:hypothetical protein
MTSLRWCVLLAALAGCVGLVGEVLPLDDHQRELLADERAAYQGARSVLAARCARCHHEDGGQATGNKLDHFDITVYPFGGRYGTHTPTLRRVLGLDGSAPIMPFDEPGILDDEELATIEAWIDAYDAAEAAGAHGDDPR